MRRLAKQSREDVYSSLRDYQSLQDRESLRIRPHGTGPNCLVLTGPITERNSNIVGAGGFLMASEAIEILATLKVGDASVSGEFQIGTVWGRFALIIEAPAAESLELSLQWPEGVTIDLWGIAGDGLSLPDTVKDVGIAALAVTHLAPETFYLDHDNALALDIDEGQSSSFELDKGDRLAVKKCSYCGRFLPVNPAILGSLSFHKHNAKLTKHQNECRSCKKWRINDTFNPLRTTDQLHESSVITRERKLFLREPEILQRIKDRTGAGLKSQIWQRFDKKCFYCGAELPLGEVQLDHTRPLAYLWPIDEFATCLCADHNNQKREKFPIDFYSEGQLEQLSEITGLSLDELSARRVNELELKRILDDIIHFAIEWDPRTFNATARKVAEIHPEINLFEILKTQNPETYLGLLARLEDRPDPVIEDE